MFYHKLAFALLARPRRLLTAGFTLLEVLISVIISGLIVTGLLYLVVEALQLDRREIVLNQVQGDMRRAIDYISTDLREAVFVYPPTDPNGLGQGATDIVLGDNGLSNIPNDWELILALWRLDPLDGESALPNCEAIDANQTERVNECEVLRIRQAFYTLVAYFQVPNDPDTSIWEGGSRIVRYTLPRYTQGNVTNLVRTPGFNDPTAEGVSFETWERREGESTGNVAARSAVLVDNVAPLELGDPDDFCERETGSAPNLYIPTPVSDANSFIACVRNSQIGSSSDRGNQDVFLFLRGDATTGAGREFINPFSQDSRFPPISARVLVRGVLEKPAPL